MCDTRVVQRALVLFLIFLLGIALHLPAIFKPPLSGTEAHRVITGVQMYERGEYVVPRLYGAVYLRKPPLIYWTHALIAAITDNQNWAHRIPSVIAIALTATIVAAFTMAWLNTQSRPLSGTLPGIVAGLCVLSMVALWPQSRSGDIDALNTLFASSAALLILHIGQPRSQTRFSRIAVCLALCLGLSLCIAATLLLKFHAGLSVILGAIIACAFVYRSAFRWKIISISLVAGFILFAIWPTLLWLRFKQTGEPPDLSGLKETAGTLRPDSLFKWLGALLLPPTVLIYALPASLALFVVPQPKLLRLLPGSDGSSTRSTPVDQIRTTLIALLIALLLPALVGIGNPRYVYVSLPLIGVLCGACVVLYQQSADAKVKKAILTLACVFAGLLSAFALAVGIVGKSSPTPFIIAGVLGVLVIVGIVRTRAAAPVLLIFAGLLFASAIASIPQFTRNQTRQSAVDSGTQFASFMDATFPGERVHAGMLVFAKPEFFLNIAHRTSAPRVWEIKPDDVPIGEFALLNETEFAKWNKSDSATEISQFDMPGNKAILVRRK